MRGRKNDALRTVSMYGLAVYDALLYLDAYPYNEDAKKYFVEMTENEKHAVCEYEKNYGPLTASASAEYEGWQWSEGPWPWQNCEGGN